MLGIGLGGFMDGYQRGQQIRDNKIDRQRTEVMHKRQDQEYDRVVSQRSEIDGINTQAKKEFDTRVAAGTENPNNFDTFWTGYALPKLKNTYLAQGNVEMADKVQAWGDSEDTRAGAKLAMSALLKAQTGDAAGALTDAMEAGKKKGYITHGYEIQKQDTIVDTDGKLQGYRLFLKGPDGKDIQQDLPLAQVPKMIATYLNPEAAWQSQIATQAEAGKDAKELKVYEEKKKIDKAYGTGENKSRTDAIASLRKRMDGGLGTDTKFDDLPREEQEKLISSELELQGGQPGLAGGPIAQAAPAGSGRKVLVDSATGQPAPPEARPQPRAENPRAPAASAKPESREERISFMVQSAEQAIADGEQPERIADGLRQNGISEDLWPKPLRDALGNTNRVIGLGR
ncbi:hypothetical protein [Rhizobium sp. 18065]|uniref:hypothetical protein n=1 Tax=Rhizobium sp. 18065 TaxID=2681411 RepID=UPI00135C49D1|nr:hypothetical protein [Rhizobium sp. 18065]